MRYLQFNRNLETLVWAIDLCSSQNNATQKDSDAIYDVEWSKVSWTRERETMQRHEPYVRAAVKNISSWIRVPPHNWFPALNPKDKYSDANFPPTIFVVAALDCGTLRRWTRLFDISPLIEIISIFVRNTLTIMLRVPIMVNIFAIALTFWIKTLQQEPKMWELAGDFIATLFGSSERLFSPFDTFLVRYTLMERFRPPKKDPMTAN
jgi:hypothetical protein